MTAVDLDALEAALAAATPGPWYVARRIHMFSDATSHPGIGETYMPADAALIVAAVNALPDLIAAVRRIEALHVASRGYCAACDADRDVDRSGNNPDCPHSASFCRACDYAWPCPTRRALAGPS